MKNLVWANPALTGIRCIGLIALLAFLAGRAQADGSFEFQSHFVDQDPEWAVKTAGNVVADIDGDGDLDWTAGNSQWLGKAFYWYEYQGPDTWVRHYVGEGFSDCGAAGLDVNGDGQVDLVVGQILFINKNHGQSWERYQIGTTGANMHEEIVADLSGDGKQDVLFVNSNEGCYWYEVPSDPTAMWTVHNIILSNQYNIHGGPFPQGVADLDGDGDLDAANAHGWNENLGGGLSWAWRLYGNQGGTIGDPNQQYGLCVRSVCRDMDGDGDMDIVQSEGDHVDASAAWLENTDGKGNFLLHWIVQHTGQDLHGLQVEDFDKDGDWDVLTGGGPLTPSGNANKTMLFENTAGKNVGPSSSSWIEHDIMTGPESYEMVCADWDKDGDMDIVTKFHYPPGSFYFLENLLPQAPTRTAAYSFGRSTKPARVSRFFNLAGRSMPGLLPRMQPVVFEKQGTAATCKILAK